MPSGSALLSVASGVRDKEAASLFDRVQQTTLPLSKAWHGSVVTELTSAEAEAAATAGVGGGDATPPSNGRGAAGAPSFATRSGPPPVDLLSSRGSGLRADDDDPTTQPLASPGLSSMLAPPAAAAARPHPHRLSGVALAILSSDPEGVIRYDSPGERLPYVRSKSADSNMHPMHVYACATLACMACAWRAYR